MPRIQGVTRCPFGIMIFYSPGHGGKPRQAYAEHVIQPWILHAGGDLLLAAPQQQVLRVLTLTRLIDVFPVHASVDEAARTAGLSRRAAAPADGHPARVA
jgi:hypothetical protein